MTSLLYAHLYSLLYREKIIIDLYVNHLGITVHNFP
jgi:hypothetical protein